MSRTPDTVPFDAADVATTLCGIATVALGAQSLRSLRLNRDQLLEVAAALNLTRLPARTSTKHLTEKVLHRAIAARRKCEGLRHW